MEKMQVRWADHDKLIGGTFKSLFDDEALTDIRLCCKDGVLEAHKLVMATCSPYFRKIFEDNRDIRMVVLVNGVKTSEMKLLLEFMYKGRVQIEPKMFHKISGLAEQLEVKNFEKSDDFEDTDQDKQGFFKKLNMFVANRVWKNNLY